MILVFVLLSCAGLTCILRYGSILSWPRSILVRCKYFRELFNCSLCLGFWSGVGVAGYLWYTSWENHFTLLPLASAITSWIVDGVVRLLQTAEMVLDKKLEK